LGARIEDARGTSDLDEDAARAVASKDRDLAAAVDSEPQRLARIVMALEVAHFSQRFADVLMLQQLDEIKRHARLLKITKRRVSLGRQGLLQGSRDRAC